MKGWRRIRSARQAWPSPTVSGRNILVWVFDAVGEAVKALGQGKQLFLAAEIKAHPPERDAAQLPSDLSVSVGRKPAIVYHEHPFDARNTAVGRRFPMELLGEAGSAVARDGRRASDCALRPAANDGP